MGMPESYLGIARHHSILLGAIERPNEGNETLFKRQRRIEPWLLRDNDGHRCRDGGETYGDHPHRSWRTTESA